MTDEPDAAVGVAREEGGRVVEPCEGRGGSGESPSRGEPGNGRVDEVEAISVGDGDVVLPADEDWRAVVRVLRA